MAITPGCQGPAPGMGRGSLALRGEKATDKQGALINRFMYNHTAPTWPLAKVLPAIHAGDYTNNIRR